MTGYWAESARRGGEVAERLCLSGVELGIAHQALNMQTERALEELQFQCAEGSGAARDELYETAKTFVTTYELWEQSNGHNDD